MNYDDLIDLARQHEPGGSLPGFETRLRARISELRHSDDASRVFSLWLWRASWGLTPVATALTVVLFVFHGTSIPDGADSILHHLAAYLPGLSL
ncbi:MAG: hypothetical protein KDM63_07370 [Verrucomicrobiae bacterium]|nr:hypothetical protein [Verrucomicrobiae bacterium]MCB1086848.1 hypothetical protein [Verrucomicrobiae bacterium]